MFYCYVYYAAGLDAVLPGEHDMFTIGGFTGPTFTVAFAWAFDQYLLRGADKCFIMSNGALLQII